MSDSQQLPLDIEVEQTPWGKWVDPDRRAAQVTKFMEYAGLQQLPVEPWEVGSLEVERMNGVLARLLPDMDAASVPANRDITDALVCFMGECFVRFAGAEWIDWHDFAPDHSFYENVNPAVQCDTLDEDEIGMWHLIRDITESYEQDGGRFSYFASTVREYAEYHDEKQSSE